MDTAPWASSSAPQVCTEGLGLGVDTGPESETNLVPEGRSSTQSTWCGRCPQLELDFKARPSAQHSGWGDYLSVSSFVTAGRPLL